MKILHLWITAFPVPQPGLNLTKTPLTLRETMTSRALLSPSRSEYRLQCQASSCGGKTIKLDHRPQWHVPKWHFQATNLDHIEDKVLPYGHTARVAGRGKHAIRFASLQLPKVRKS